jgi:hypothetical protein
MVFGRARQACGTYPKPNDAEVAPEPEFAAECRNQVPRGDPKSGQKQPTGD